MCLDIGSLSGLVPTMKTAFHLCFFACIGVFHGSCFGEEAKKQSAKPKVRIGLPGESLTIANNQAFLFLPDKAKMASPQPWIFYCPTLPQYPDEAERWMHERFLEAGIVVAGIDVGEAYGNPKSHEAFNALYEELVNKRGFAKKPCLFGRSRGGLWVSSWAIANPQRVAGIVGIYPVFDFRTYPKLEKAAPAYGLSPEELGKRSAELNPIERIEQLAKAKIAFTIIHGDSDVVVPLKENSAELLRRYEAAGAKELVTLIIAKDQGHSFWEGFFHEQAIVDFAIAKSKSGAVGEK
jgi:alpha-beta hydrolase superfamily lysophospholipase